MADLNEKIILSVDLDVDALNDKLGITKGSIDEVKASIKSLEAQKKVFIEQGKSVEDLNKQIVTLQSQLRGLTSTQKGLQNQVDLTTKANQAANGSYEQLLRNWQLASISLKTLEGTLQKNTDGTFILTDAYKQQSQEVGQAKDALDKFNLTVSDGRTNVGNYAKSLNPLTAEVAGLRKEHKDLRNVMQGAIGALGLLNILGGEGEKVTETQKAALIGLVAIQNISEIRLGIAATLKSVDTLLTEKQTVATEGLTVATETQTIAQEALTAAMDVNPLILFLTVLAGALVAIGKWVSSTRSAGEEVQKTDKFIDDSKVRLEELKLKYQNLTGAISDTQIALIKAGEENDKRVKAIKDQTLPDLEETASAWDKFKISVVNAFDPAAAAEIAANSQSVLKVLDVQRQRLAANDEVFQQEQKNLKAEEALKKAKDASIGSLEFYNHQLQEAQQRLEKTTLGTEAYANALLEFQRASFLANIAQQSFNQSLRDANDLSGGTVVGDIKVSPVVDAALQEQQQLDQIQQGTEDFFVASQDRMTKKVLEALDIRSEKEKEAAIDQRQILEAIGSELFNVQQAALENQISTIQTAADEGVITQKKAHEEIAKLKTKEAISQRAQALFNITINTAESITKAYAQGTIIGAAVTPFLVGLGVTEAAAVLAAPLPKFERGGIIGGKPHSQGGTKFYGEDGTRFEAEAGELITVVNKNATGMLGSLSWLNQLTGGVPFMGHMGTNYLADGGFAARAISAPVTAQLDTNALLEMIQQLPAPVVRVSDINNVNAKLVSVSDRANS